MEEGEGEGEEEEDEEEGNDRQDNAMNAAAMIALDLCICCIPCAFSERLIFDVYCPSL